MSLRNADLWAPTKFVATRRGLRASRDERAVTNSSRLIADLVAGFYDEVLPEHARGRLLDLGCGTAPLYGAYRDHVADVTCVDWSNSLHAISHIDIEHDLTEPLPFGTDRFDTIILSDVLEHIPEPQDLCHEMARTLAPGGKLLMNVPFAYWLHEEPHDYYRFTAHALRRLAETAGFAVIEIRPLGGMPEVLTDVASKMVRSLRGGRRMASAVQAAGAWLARSRGGRKLTRRTRNKLPLGYGMIARKP